MYRGRTLQSRIMKRTPPGHDMVFGLAKGHQGRKAEISHCEHAFRDQPLCACCQRLPRPGINAI